MRIPAFVQARVGSTRFPGKVLADLGGMPMIRQLCRRLAQAELVSDIYVLAPEKDVAVLTEAVAGNACVIGSGLAPEDDVAWRHLYAASLLGARRFVRVPGDNPCVDPKVVDATIREATVEPRDIFVSSYPLGGGWIDGVGCEVWSWELMYEVVRRGTPEQHEHPHRFPVSVIRVDATSTVKLRGEFMRCDVNEPLDLEPLRVAFAELGPDFTSDQLIYWAQTEDRDGVFA